MSRARFVSRKKLEPVVEKRRRSSILKEMAMVKAVLPMGI